MGVLQMATGLSFGPGHSPVINTTRHILIVLFAYLFCVVYSIGEGPVPLVSIHDLLSTSLRTLLTL